MESHRGLEERALSSHTLQLRGIHTASRLRMGSGAHEPRINAHLCSWLSLQILTRPQSQSHCSLVGKYLPSSKCQAWWLSLNSLWVLVCLLFLQIPIPGSPGSSAAFLQERPLSPDLLEAGRVDQPPLSEEQEKAGLPVRLAGEATRRALPLQPSAHPTWPFRCPPPRVRGITTLVLATDSLSTLVL